MTSSFLKGDLVRLKSGSPTMTVTSPSAEYGVVYVARYERGKVITERICEEALVRASSPEKPWLAIFVEGAAALEITSGSENALVNPVLMRQPGVLELVESALCMVADEVNSDLPAAGTGVAPPTPAAIMGDVAAELVLPVHRDIAKELGQAALNQRPEDQAADRNA